MLNYTRRIAEALVAVLLALYTPTHMLGQTPTGPEAEGKLSGEAAGSSVPVATQWLFDSLGTTGRGTVTAVYRVFCGITEAKGTGFALDTGYLVTNAHVVEGCRAEDLQVFSATAKREPVADLVSDSDRDLAAARFVHPTASGLKIDTSRLLVGTQICTWGHPLAYDGPPPILTVGYVSGFAYQPTPPTRAVPTKTLPIKQLILNAAINPGNSGGPLFCLGKSAVIGVIVSKHAPISRFLVSAIDALAKNHSGVVFTGTDAQGRTVNYVESQVVAEVLLYFREMTQVVIGQAIAASELVAFLESKRIPWNSVASPNIGLPAHPKRK